MTKTTRNKVLPVTLPLDQYDYLLKQANHNGESMAAYLRRLIRADKDKNHQIGRV